MKVLLIDIDSKIPNLALKKIEKYHLDKGDEVIWNNELFRTIVDKIYVSCIYSWNKNKCFEWNGAEIGGSGFDLKKELPPEIEAVKPRINFGFTTRGCIRKCPFCIVPEKEGKIQAIGDIYNLWDGKSKKIILLDNNILALPNHFFKIALQIRKEKLKVDFNQGLDCRLLTDEIAKTLSGLSHSEYRFAFDTMAMESEVDKTIKLLRRYGIKRCTWYVLVGFNTTFKEDLYRLNFLRDRNQNTFVQRYNKKMNRFYNEIASWSAQHNIFHTHTWKQYCRKRKNKLDKPKTAR